MHEATGQTYRARKLARRKGFEAKDFDLKLEIKRGGSVIQYRSQNGVPWIRPLRPSKKPHNLNWMTTGPRTDIWFPVNPQHAEYTGQSYSENTMLGTLAWRGEMVGVAPYSALELIGSIADRDALGGLVKTNDWNEYEIVTPGGICLHIVNGHLMAVLFDDDPASSNNQSGKFGIDARRYAPEGVGPQHLDSEASLSSFLSPTMRDRMLFHE